MLDPVRQILIVMADEDQERFEPSGPPPTPDPEPEEVAQLVRQLIQFVEALKKGEEVPSGPLGEQRSNGKSFTGPLLVP